MSELKKKTIINKIKFAFLIIINLFLVFTAGIGSIYVSLNNADVYKMVQNDGYGNFDFAGYDFTKDTVYTGQQGNVEFYYNRWIVSDNDEGAMDSYIHLPSYWTGMKIGDETLPRSGYASYQIHCYNLEPGTTLVSHFLRVPGKIFYNKTLVYQKGEPTKTQQNATVPLVQAFRIPYVVPSDGKVDVVIELGNVNIGGIRTMPGFTIPSNLPFIYHETIDNVNIALTAVLIATWIFSIGVFFLPKSRKSLFILISALMVLFIISPDGPFYMNRFNFPYRNEIFTKIAVVFGFSLVTSALMLYEQEEKNVVILQKEWAFTFINQTLMHITIFFTYYTPYALISYAFGLMPLAMLLIKEIKRMYLKGIRYDLLINSFLTSLVMGLFICSAEEATGILTFDITSFYIYAISVLVYGYLIVYLIKYLKMKNKEREESLQDVMYHRLLSKSLSSSLKEEEISLGLDFIKDEYSQSLTKGRKSLTLFSSYLRDEIKNFDEDKIYLQEEITNALKIIEYKNLLLQKEIELIIDFEEENFLVPKGIICAAIEEIYLNDYNAEVILEADERKNNLLTIEINSKVTISSSNLENLIKRIDLNHEFKLVRIINETNTIYKLLKQGD